MEQVLFSTVSPVRSLIPALATFSIVAVTASGCSLVSGPVPDATLVGLERTATAVAAGNGTAQWSDIATQLHSEAVRLCGVTRDGETPSSCEYTVDPGTLEVRSDHERTAKKLPQPPLPEYTIDATTCAKVAVAVSQQVASTEEDARNALLTGLSQVDESSRPLIAQLYVQAAAANPNIPSLALDQSIPVTDQLPSLRGCSSEVTLGANDKQSLNRALAWQEAAQYGLTTAAAFATPDSGNTMVAAARAHEDLEHLLEELVHDATPGAAAGYSTPQVTPVDQPTALQFAVTAEVESTRMWLELASTAEDPAWRELCVRAAGLAAQRALPFITAAGMSPQEAGLPQA